MGRIVVIGASAGGLQAVTTIVATLPKTSTASVFVVIHVGANPSILPSILTNACALPASHPENGERIVAGHVYVAPPDRHMLLSDDRIWLSNSPKVHFTRPAADPLFQTAAEAYGDRVVGIVLSGGGSDGAAGLRAIKARGGVTIVQVPDEAEFPSMPRAAIAMDNPDCLTVREIAVFLASLRG